MVKHQAERPLLHLEDLLVHSESTYCSAQICAVISQRSKHPHTHFGSRSYELTQEWACVSVEAPERHSVGVLSTLQKVIPKLVSHAMAGKWEPPKADSLPCTTHKKSPKRQRRYKWPSDLSWSWAPCTDWRKLQPNLHSQVQLGSHSGVANSQHSANPRKAVGQVLLFVSSVLLRSLWSECDLCCLDECPSPCGCAIGHFGVCGYDKWFSGHQMEPKPCLSSQDLTASGSLQKPVCNSELLCGFYPFGVAYTRQATLDNCCPAQRGTRWVAQGRIAQGKALVDSSKTWSFKINSSKQMFEEVTVNMLRLQCGKSNMN